MTSSTENSLESIETLDELQRELQCILEMEKKKRQDEDEAEQHYAKKVAPVLYRLREYLGELISLLNNKKLQQSEKTRHLCNPEIDYNLATIGVSAFGLLQGRQVNYEIITSTQAGRLADFCLHYQCTPERPVGVQCVKFRKTQDYARRFRIQERLKKYDLKYDCVEQPCQDGSVKMLFTLQPVIPIKFEFSGNADGESFQLVISNSGGQGRTGLLGTMHFPRVTPEQVGVESIEALISLIIRQPNRLHWYWGGSRNSQQPTEEEELTPSDSIYDYNIPTQKQSSNFNEVNVRSILARIQKQNAAVEQEVKQSHKQQSKKLDEVQESLEEYNRRAEQEHHKYMDELGKIADAVERGRAENRTIFSWLVAMLSLGRKQQ